MPEDWQQRELEELREKQEREARIATERERLRDIQRKREDDNRSNG
jgi:hypothetical protein